MFNIQYLPYRQIESLSTNERIKVILSILREGRVVIIDGRLKTIDEAALIRETMDCITDDFSGVEFAVLHDHKQHKISSRIRHSIARMLVGDRSGITIIGPANIISEFRQNPQNIEIYFKKEYLKDCHDAALARNAKRDDEDAS